MRRRASDPGLIADSCRGTGAARNVLYAMALSLAALSSAAAAPGDLDPTFGVGGKVLPSLGGGGVPSKIVLKGDGGIAVLGTASDADFAVVHYTPEGMFDSAYGIGGRVTGFAPAGVIDIALQTDGKIVVLGTANTIPGWFIHDFVLARFNSDGTPDSSFGTGGMVSMFVTDPNGFTYGSYPVFVLVQPDGKIIAGGGTDTGSAFYGTSLVRLDVDGTLDPTFGTGGMSFFWASIYPTGGALLQPDGTFTVLGYFYHEVVPGTHAIMRFHSDGSPTCCGEIGYVGTGASWPSGAFSIAPQRDGRFVVFLASQGSSGVVRYLPSGGRDLAFGHLGELRRDACGFDAATGGTDGKTVLVGSWDNDFGLARYNANGTGDLSFGVGGMVATDLAGGLDTAAVATVQDDGRILVAGSATNGSTAGFALARYLGATEPTSTTTTTSSTTTTLPGCGSSPRQGCILPGRAVVVMRETSTGNEKLKVVLSQLGEATTQVSLGNPATGSTRYDACLYGDDEVLLAALTVDRGAQVCGNPPKACWVPLSDRGFKYKDRDASADGVQKVVAKSGPVGLGGMTLKAGNKATKGQASMPTGLTSALQGASHVTVQFLTSDGQCFGGRVDDLSRTDLGLFKADGAVTSPSTTSTTSSTSTSSSTSSTTTTTLCAGQFCDLGNGTVHDPRTGLQWEKKTTVYGSGENPTDLHDVDNLYPWAGTCSANPGKYCQQTPAAEAACLAAVPEGWARVCELCGALEGSCTTYLGVATGWEWLSQLNASNFAGHGDWRLPSDEGRGMCPGTSWELETVLREYYPCEEWFPCVDSSLGPIAESYYWSSTLASATSAWLGDLYYAYSFSPGGLTGMAAVRAVR